MYIQLDIVVLEGVIVNYIGFFSNNMLFSVMQLFIIFISLFYTLKFRPTILQFIIGMSMICIPAIFSYLFLFNWLGYIYFIIATIYYFYYYVKSRKVLLDVFILLIISMITMTVLQIIEIQLLYRIDNYYLAFTKGTFFYEGFTKVIYLCCFILIAKLYYKFTQKTWNPTVLSVMNQILLITIAFITVTVLSLNLFISLSNNLYYPALFNLMMQVIYFVIMFVLFIFLISNTKKQQMIVKKETENEQLFQYMQALERINNDMQGFRHDYQNILVTMQGYINADDMSGLKEYFSKRIMKVKHKTLKNNYIYNQLDKVNVIELKGMLSNKVLVAEEWNVELNVEVPEIIDNIEMDIIDLTRIVGILMDNAIEATRELKDRQVNVGLLKTPNHSNIFIIENSFLLNTIQTEKLFTPGYTTKEGNLGIGLSTVREILEDYPNITLNTRIENGLFIHEMEVRDIHAQQKSSVHFPIKTALQYERGGNK